MYPLMDVKGECGSLKEDKTYQSHIADSQDAWLWYEKDNLLEMGAERLSLHLLEEKTKGLKAYLIDRQ